ncbi:MAG: DUF6711 family protein [Oscillospiraceae bacterium]
MAYEGYLVQIGNYKIPMKFIQAENYTVTLNSQDLDSYQDANGNLQRTALNNFVPKVEFQTRPMLTRDQMNELFSNIRANYTNAVERRSTAKIYIPELDSYVTQSVYLSDPEFSIWGIINGKIYYNSLRIAFIGYGGTAI